MTDRTVKTINEHNEASASSAYNFNLLLQGINGAEHLRSNLGNAGIGIIAPYYDETTGCSKGSLFIYAGRLYKATADITAGTAAEDDDGFALTAEQITLVDLRPKYRTVVLSATGWASNEQIVAVDGVTEDNAVMTAFAPSSLVEAASCMVYCSAQGDGTLTFSCSTTPENNLAVNLRIED